MPYGISIVCAIAGHPEILETVSFAPDYSYSGQRLLASLQGAHDAQCACATRIHKAWEVQVEYADVEAMFKSLPEDDEDNPRMQLVAPYDTMWQRFPTQPPADVVSIICATAFPTSPTSSSFSSSTGSKCSRMDGSDNSIGDSEPDRKRANTRTPSPGDLSNPLDDPPQLPYSSCYFLDSKTNAGIVFLDKTRPILDFPDRYRYLLIRPPRFGKTSFLSALTQFYDLRKGDSFGHFFESLVATAESRGIPEHNTHLCLSFKFSKFHVLSNLSEIAVSWDFFLSLIVQRFLSDYAVELEISDPESFMKDANTNLLPELFALVRSRGHKLFVAVDDYDAPVQSRFFAHLSPWVNEPIASQQGIESFMDSHFWQPLYAASDVVHKLFVTGTFSLKSPNLENLGLLDLDPMSSSQFTCGFTEQETIDLAKLVSVIPGMDHLRRCCGEYMFSREDDVGKAVELHPQRVIAELAVVSRRQVLMQDDDRSFRLLDPLFELLPEESPVSGAVTTNGLINLLATGIVEFDGEIPPPLHAESSTLTWSTLHHLGALTYDRRLEGALRVANGVVLTKMHRHIDTVVSARYNLAQTIPAAVRQYAKNSDPEPFLEVLSDVLCGQVKRSYDTRRHEPDLRGVFELVVGNAFCKESLRLIDGIEFFCLEGETTRVHIKDPADNVARLWELRTLTLLGMWRGQNPNDEDPSLAALQKLHEELMDEKEAQLLERPYRAWSATPNVMETVLVRSFVEVELEMPLFLAVGGARVLMRR